LCLLTDDKKHKINHETDMTMHGFYRATTTTKNPPIIRPHIVFTDGRQQRQIKPYFDHIVCLLTDDNNNKPTIIRPPIVLTDGRQQRQIQPSYDHILCLLTDDNKDKPNHNTTTFCVY